MMLKKNKRLVVVIVICGLTTFFAQWIARKIDSDMRVNFLQQAELVAQSVNIDRVKRLSGTKEDLNSGCYLRIKEQFANAQTTNDKYSFIYLMGQKDDGSVFFYVDSEPVGSENESPAGQTYDEISDSYLKVFNSRQKNTTGSEVNRWGEWISSLVPICDPQTGEIVFVLGIDIDASLWRRMVASKCVLPVGLVLLLLFATSGAVYTMMLNTKLSKSIIGRKQSERDAKAERDKLQSLVDGLASVGIGIDIVGVDYKIHFQNKFLADSFGAVDGQLCYEVYLGREEPCDSCPMVQSIENRHTNGFEIRTENGRIYEVMAVPFVNPDGTVDKVIEIIRDITNSKQAEEKLKQTYAKLERFNRLMVGREERVIEMKKDVNSLLAELGREPQYESVLYCEKTYLQSEV